MIKKYTGKILQNSFGVSLAETMVVLLIFVFLASGIYTLGIMGDRFWQMNRAKIELHQELRKALEWMINDLRQAGDISITNVPANGSWYSTITFKTPVGVTSGVLDWSTDAIQFVLGGTGSKQLLGIQGADTDILAQNMKFLQFRRQVATPDILEVAMGAEKTTNIGILVDYQLSFSIQLRN